MKKYLNTTAVILLLLTTIIFSGCGKKENKNVSVDTKQQVEENGKYLYLVAKDNSKENEKMLPDMVMCNNKLDKIKIEDDISPKEALQKLFDYRDNDKFINPLQKFTNLKIEDVVVKNDFAIVKLSKGLTVDKFVCNTQDISNQIKKTLTQFDDIAGVDIFVGDEEFGSYIDNLRMKNDKK